MSAVANATGAIMGLVSHSFSPCLLALCGAAWGLHRVRAGAELQHRGELALRKELLGYLLYTESPGTLPAPEMARQISRLVAVRSSFGRAALLLRNAEGLLQIAGSAGFDDLSTDALNRWGHSVSRKDLSLMEIAEGRERVGTSSFTVTLDRRCEERNPLSTMSCKQVHIVPLRTAHGLLGALVVCVQPRSGGKPRKSLWPMFAAAAPASLPLADLLQPLEALALRLTMQLTAPGLAIPAVPDRTGPRLERQQRQERGQRQERHARSVKTRERQARTPEAASRRSLDDTAAPLGDLSTSGALDRVRQILDPAASPLSAISGVSGRPPARVWR